MSLPDLAASVRATIDRAVSAEATLGELAHQVADVLGVTHHDVSIDVGSPSYPWEGRTVTVRVDHDGARVALTVEHVPQPVERSSV